MYQLITAPTVEPVSLSDVKSHLRITESSQDTLISGLLIPTARQRAETITRRALCTQTWELVADQFAGPSLVGIAYGRAYTLPAHALLIDKCPVQSVTSIKYTAMDGSTVTMTPSDYIADLTSEPTRITPVFGKIWPIPMPQIASVRVRFVAGYGAAADVPAAVRSWMLLYIGALFENRELIAVLQRGMVAELPFVEGLLDGYRVPVV